MSKKNNKYVRKRKHTIIFKLSDTEKEMLDKLAYLSALKKQDYIMKRLMNEEVTVSAGVTVQKHIENTIDKIIFELNSLRERQTLPSSEMKILINTISEMISDMKGDTPDE